MWYAASSVCFKTVKSVTEYNKILMSNMVIDNKNISTTVTTTVDSTGTGHISTTAITTADSTGTKIFPQLLPQLLLVLALNFQQALF